MSNKKFKLSDMIPNAWFYKLKHMNKTSKNTHSLSSSMLKKHHHSPPPPPPPPPPSPPSTLKTPPQPEPQCQSRKSYHITRELTIDLLKTPPRKSKSRKSSRRSSSTSSCSCQSTSTSQSSLKETDVVKTVDNVRFLVEDVLLKTKAGYANKQSILDNNALASNNKKPEHCDIVVENFNFQIAPIITRKETQHKKIIKEEKLKPHLLKEHMNSPPSRRLTINSPRGVRLKINSPRNVGRKQGQNGNKIGGRRSTSSKKRRSISESFAVVKSSFDPQKDFKESMVEMIVQNNLRAPKDLENLLACYLSLNSDEYHDVIIKVFKQIWFDFRHQQ